MPNPQVDRPGPPGVGQFVRTRRLALGLTQEELAEKAGISQKYVSSIEGKSDLGYLPPVDTVNALAAGLNVHPNEIVWASGYLNDEELERRYAEVTDDPLLEFWASHRREFTTEEKRAIVEVAKVIRKGKEPS